MYQHVAANRPALQEVDTLTQSFYNALQPLLFTDDVQEFKQRHELILKNYNNNHRLANILHNDQMMEFLWVALKFDSLYPELNPAKLLPWNSPMGSVSCLIFQYKKYTFLMS
jgi:hypothetical protein